MKGDVEYIAEGQIFHGSIAHVMGTRLELLAVGVCEDSIMRLWNQIYDRVFGLDRMLNRFEPSSEVSQLNMHDNPLEHEMSEELAHMLVMAKEYEERTRGLFDIMDDEGKMDFGGFAKGYFLKICAGMLRNAGVECAFVDFGGSSILGIGHHPYGESWKVGIVNPFTRMTIKDVELVEMAMSTSGNTPYYSGHIRNPRTGETCPDRRMTTVLSPDPLDAEILSTVLMIAGKDDKEAIDREFPAAEWEEFDL